MRDEIREVLEGKRRWCVVNGDCLDIMADLPPASLDALVADPPYCAGAISEARRTSANGQGLRSENLRRFGWFVGDNMGTAGLCWLLRSVAVVAKHVVKPTGGLITFCDWRMLSALQPAVESAGVRYQSLIVWDKGSMGLGSGFRNQHEMILHFTLGDPEYHDRSIANVIRCPRVTGDDREHQTQKPVEVMAELLKVVSPSGGIVLDPFCGSASTGVACLELGRRFIGIEEGEGYCEIARRRLALAEAADRSSLFPAAPHAPAASRARQLTFDDVTDADDAPAVQSEHQTPRRPTE
jgi:site-specific DNA-methyltransferase (adenine-specific)